MTDQLSDPLELSVVIVNYKTCQLTLDCLASVYRSAEQLGLECIIIDNASADGLIDALRVQFPQATIIANTDNRYFSAAYNQGIAAARGRYVIVLNSDMVVQGQALAQLVRQLDADSTIGAATTTMFFSDGRLQRNGSQPVSFRYLLINYTFLGKLLPGTMQALSDQLWYADWDRKTRREVGVLPGSCIIASRATWQATGGFDERMPLYFSDDYLSRAVRKLHKQTVYLISDGIIHYEGGSARRVKAQALRLYFHDLLVYTRLVFGRGAQIVLGVLMIPTWIVLRIKASRPAEG